MRAEVQQLYSRTQRFLEPCMKLDLSLSLNGSILHLARASEHSAYIIYGRSETTVHIVGGAKNGVNVDL